MNGRCRTAGITLLLSCCSVSSINIYFVAILSEDFMVDPFFIPWVNISFQNLANRSLVDDTFRKVNGLKPIAAELGVSLAQLSIAWCASNPNVSSVITGATKESQVQFTNPCSSEDCFFKQVFLNR
jgi:hypothetical protein